MDLRDGVLPDEALKVLQDIPIDEIKAGVRSKGVSAERSSLLCEVVRDEREVDFYIGVDIKRYALKCLRPEFYAELRLGDHIYSTSGLYEYDPPKNGQNIIKHGLGFREVVSYSSQFGTLLVPCPDGEGGTRCVIFSDLNAGLEGGNLEIPLSGMAGQVFTMSVAQQGGGKFRFISARVLTKNSYKDIMSRAFKNIYKENSAAKNEFVGRCVEIVEQQLFKV